jgi:hypothetical protein
VPEGTVYTEGIIMEKNREAWLRRAVELMRPYVAERTGHHVPDGLWVSVGFPVTGARSGSRNQRIGECHYATADGVPAVFIHPELADGARVLDVLLHEALHAALPVGTGHRKPFARAATSCGLAGKPTATIVAPGSELAGTIEAWLTMLGDYPHAAVSTANRKKQTTRMLKVECLADGYTVRMTRKWLDEMGAPSCPCGEIMLEA